MKNGISNFYGPQPAVDHFNVNDVLQKAQTVTTDAGNIINVLRNQVSAIVSPRQYTPQPAPSAAMNAAYLKPATPAASKLASVSSVSPWLIVGILVAVIGIVWFVKR